MESIEDEEDVFDRFLFTQKQKFQPKESHAEAEKQETVAADYWLDEDIDIEDLIAGIESDDECEAGSNIWKEDARDPMTADIEVVIDQNETHEIIVAEFDSQRIPSQQSIFFSSPLTAAISFETSTSSSER